MSSPSRVRFQPLNHYRTSRMWNINVNIVASDLIGTAITAIVVETIQAHLKTSTEIVGFTAILDGIISLLLFAILHLQANRDRGVKDLVRVQMHRWILCPLNFLSASGLQFLLLACGVRPSVGVLIAYVSALVFVRAIHTIYGKRTGLFQ